MKQSVTNLRDKKIIFFDDLCPQCSVFAQWLGSRVGGDVLLASIYGETAQEFFDMGYLTVNPAECNTMLVFYKGRFFYKWEALSLSMELTGYKVFLLLSKVPASMGGLIYDFLVIVRNFTSKKESCQLPRKCQLALLP